MRLSKLLTNSGDDRQGCVDSRLLKVAWRGLRERDPVSKNVRNTVCNHSESYR